MKIYNNKQGTQEWLLARLGKLTASDAYTISVNGKGLETLCLKKVSEILTNKIDDGYKSEAMINGNNLEAEARNAYELETGETVNQVGFCELDYMTGASPDGFLGEDGLIEIKCKTDTVFVKDLLGSEIDTEHYYQMQMQMLVTGRKYCSYVVYNPNFKKSLIIKRLDRDEVAIEKIKAGIENGKAMIKTMMEKLK